MNTLVINTPKKITANNISELLYVFSIVYNKQFLQRENVELDLSKIQKIDLFGILILYKFMEYTVAHKCFKMPDVYTHSENKTIWIELKRYGFLSLFEKMIRQNTLDKNVYKDLTFSNANDFIIAPQILIRTNSKEQEKLSTRFLPEIQKYYMDEKVVSMIFHCLSEIMLNFWSHATLDAHSIVIAAGNKQYIEICCADNGEGIITTLSSIDTQTPKAKLISKAVKKGITSKPDSFHMGRGLWIIDRIATLSNGRLLICSEGYKYDNNIGKVTVNETGYWKGALFYLYLPTDNPVAPSDFMEINNELTINYTNNENNKHK